MWSSVVYEEEKNSPCSRSKHSVSLLGNYLYLFAGRNGNVPLKDFWRYDLVNRKWELLKPTGDCPPSLQEHTAVTFRENIYIFGGELGFYGDNETPLWIYESQKNEWCKMKGQKGASVPKGRRGHTALVHQESVFMYGGYCDLRGSSNELWIFHFGTESWHLIMNNRTNPPGRHKHSAIIHDENMWIYGGMTDLHERSDLWRFDMVTKKWYLIKCKINPGPLHSHVACKLPSSMVIFGGERNGQLINELWRFHFGTETWQQIQMDVICPQPVSESYAITISELQLQDSRHAKNENSPPGNSRKLRTLNGIIGQERYSPVKFRRRINAEFFSSRPSDFSYLPSAQGVMLPPRRQATTPNSCNLSFLKEISKLSQMNLSKLAPNNRCSYQMLDKTESSLEETTYEDLNDDSFQKSFRYSDSSVLREVSSLVNTPLTPSDAAKLVYLEDEEAPVCGEDFPVIHAKMKPTQNRRSYPFTNSTKTTPLVSPKDTFSEILDYASCQNIHKLASAGSHSSRTNKLSSKDAVMSFSNPNYLTARPQMVCVEEKIGRGDYVKMNSPADSLTEDSGSVEMTTLKLQPPRSLPLTGDNFHFGCERRKKYRACSAGRYNRQPVTSICIFLIGGKEPCQITSFKKPISLWKLSLTKDVY